MNVTQDSFDRSGQPKRFLALGDSYTVGASVSDDECWPVQMTERLRGAGFDFEEPTIIAENGWTTRDLMASVKAEKPSGIFELVSLLIGVNNQYDGLDEDEYVRELNTLLAWATRFAGNVPTRVVVLSIPDWSVTPFAMERDRLTIQQEIDRFNDRKKACVQDHGCQFVDVTPFSRRAGDDLSLLAADGLHPSARMYSGWCDLAFPAVNRALASGGPC